MLTNRRDLFVLATKYTVSRDRSDPNAAGNHRKNLRLPLETSLRRLRTDCLDIYWVHIWDRHTPIEETMRGILSGKYTRDQRTKTGSTRVDPATITEGQRRIATALQSIADHIGATPLRSPLQSTRPARQDERIGDVRPRARIGSGASSGRPGVARMGLCTDSVAVVVR